MLSLDDSNKTKGLKTPKSFIFVIKMNTEYKTLGELKNVSRNPLNGSRVTACLPNGGITEIRYDFAKLLPGMCTSPLNIRDIRKIAPKDRRVFMEQVVSNGLAMEVNGENSGLYSTTPIAVKTLFKIDSYSDGCLEGTMAEKRPSAQERVNYLSNAYINRVLEEVIQENREPCLVPAA